MQYYVARISEAPILDNNNKSNRVEVNIVNNLDLSPNWRHTTRSTTTVSMAETPKNELNKIWKEIIKRDNKVVAQVGVESTASQLQGEGWLAK